MILPPSEALSILEQYTYFLIFPIAVIEGPIIIIISGFLVYLGVLNVYVALLVLVIADMIGDSLYYLIGKYWRQSAWIKKIGSFLGYSEKSEQNLEKHFENHTGKTLLLAKVSHGIGGAVQVAAGIARVPYPEFLWFSFIGTVPKTIALLLVGFYAGSSYEKMDGYLNTIALFVLGAVVLTIVYMIVTRLVTHSIIKEDIG